MYCIGLFGKLHACVCQLYAFTGDYQDYHLHVLDLSHYKNVYGKWLLAAGYQKRNVCEDRCLGVDRYAM